MKTKILLLIANILIFAIPLLAIPPESDTVWTKSLFPSDIIDCSFSVTGDSIIAMTMLSGSDTISILETATGNILNKIGLKPFAHGGFTHFNTKSWIVVHISSENNGMYLYDYVNDKIIFEKFGFMGTAIAITKDDKKIYAQNNQISPKNISIFDVEKNEFIDSISSGYGAAHSLAISPDNKYLAIATGKYRTVKPDPENPDYEEERMFDKIEILNLETKEVVKEFDGPNGTQGMVYNMKFSPDGKYLGVAKLDGTIRIINIEKMELYRSFTVCDYSDYLGPWTLSFSKNIKYILTGLFGFDYSTKVYNIEANNLIKSIKVPSFTGLDATTKDSILTSYSSQITLLASNILTDIKDSIKENKDTSSIIINKLKNPTYQFNYNHLINSIKLYNYNGNSINTDNIIKVLNDVIRIETGNLGTGIYFLNINENSKIFKILISE